MVGVYGKEIISTFGGMGAPMGNKYGEGKGRPSKYTQDLANGICDRISSSSDGLRKICKEFKVDYVQVKRWLRDNESFRAQYNASKADQADHMADEIHEATDEAVKLSKKGINSFRLNGFVSAMRLRVDALKWTASKLKPKKYGDKLDLTSDNEKIEQVQIIMPSNNREKKSDVNK